LSLKPNVLTKWTDLQQRLSLGMKYSFSWNDNCTKSSKAYDFVMCSSSFATEHISTLKAKCGLLLALGTQRRTQSFWICTELPKMLSMHWTDFLIKWDTWKQL
jgi:hypothetical protein